MKFTINEEISSWLGIGEILVQVLGCLCLRRKVHSVLLEDQTWIQSLGPRNSLLPQRPLESCRVISGKGEPQQATAGIFLAGSEREGLRRALLNTVLSS